MKLKHLILSFALLLMVTPFTANAFDEIDKEKMQIVTFEEVIEDNFEFVSNGWEAQAVVSVKSAEELPFVLVKYSKPHAEIAIASERIKDYTDSGFQIFKTFILPSEVVGPIGCDGPYGTITWGIQFYGPGGIPHYGYLKDGNPVTVVQAFNTCYMNSQ